MSTEKQIAANRANAQKSTGPTTEAGKAASSQNAAKHNLTSKYLIIIPGQEDAFAQLESGLRDKLKPAGPLEEVIYKRIVECAWNMERCRMAELEVLQESRATGDSLAEPGYQDRYDRIRRYARESENSMYKAMRELGKLQAEQQFRNEIAQEQIDNPEALSSVCSMAQVLKNVVAFHKATTSKVKCEADDSRPGTNLEEIPSGVTSRFEANPDESLIAA